MKKNESKSKVSEMRSEYDFSGGVRGKYAKRFSQGTNLVVIDPELAKIFRDSDSVNRALRLLAELARKQAKQTTG
jgi:hypothetical protein